MVASTIIYWAGEFIFLDVNPFDALKGRTWLPPFKDMAHYTLFKFNFGGLFEIGVFSEVMTYITFCMACRDRFAREGRESRHILELLYGADASNMPDISEKRYNRLILKQTLLKNIWNEEPNMEKKDYTVAYTEEAIHMMDER